MRAIAVMSVVIYHAIPFAAPGGFVGVDIFFVISGFLISSIIISDLRNVRFSIANFYDRRIRRIFPALIIILLTTIAIGWFFLYDIEFFRLGKHVVSSALFFENFTLLGESGYFDADSKSKLLLHLWSLAIEEQFYIFWPLFMYVAYHGHIRFSYVFIIMGLTSFCAGLYYVFNDPAAAYYSPLGRFWELMIGAGLARLDLKNVDYFHGKRRVASLIGLILIIFSILYLSEDIRFPGYWALFPTLGTALLIATGPNGWANQKILSNRYLVWIGLISYPLYLWHWPLLSYAYVFFGGALGWKHIALRLSLVFVSIGLSFLTFRIVEIPFRMKGGTPVKLSILAASMLVVLAIGAVIAVHELPPRLHLATSVKRDEWDFLKTTRKYFDSNGNGVYEFHPERGRLTVFIGDSQLAQYAEYVAKRVDSADVNGAIFAIGGGCIPIENVVAKDVTRKGCHDVLAQGFDLAHRANVTSVVIGGAWNWYFLTSDYSIVNGPSLSTNEGKALALTQLAQEIRLLSSEGKRVFLLLGNPDSSNFSPTNFRARLYGYGVNGFEKNMMSDVRDEVFQLRKKLLEFAVREGVAVIDPFPALHCNEHQCRSTDADGLPIFKDESHFNPEWAITGTSFIDVAIQN